MRSSAWIWALLVDAQHDRALGRVEVQPDDVAHLLDEQRVLGQLPMLDAMRLQPERPPDPRDRRLASDRPRSAIWRVDQCVPPSGGAVSSVLTITSSTCSSLIFRGRPGRGSSSSPSSRARANRPRQRRTVGTDTPTRAATAVLVSPSAHASTIRERCANPAALRRLRAHRSKRHARSSPSSIATAAGPRGIHKHTTNHHRINDSRH